MMNDENWHAGTAGMRVIELSQKKFQDYELVFEYETNEQYAVCLNQNADGFLIELRRQRLPEPICKRFSERLFQRYLAKPSVYAIEVEGNPVAFLELDREFWINRLRVTDLMVLPEHRRRGYASMLMDKAKEVAQAENFRAIFLDTHSCNVGAIDFYLSQGFTLGALDTTYYSNTDVERGEVWIGLVYESNTDSARNWRYQS